MSLVSRLLRRARISRPAAPDAALARIDGRLDILEHALREQWETTTDALQRLEHRIARTQQVRGFERDPLDGVELRNVLLAIASEEPLTRRRLWTAREDPEYALAYSDTDPLVSILIATRDRGRLLIERSVPSALAQSHGNVEVVVVGDAAGAPVADALAALGDDRVRYRDLPHRVVASDDESKHWLVAATMARNEAMRMARGRWLLSLDDDDELQPDAVQRLLGLARVQRSEVAYGLLRECRADRTAVAELGDFPPRPGAFGWQAALVHGALRLFEREFVASEFAMPGDWYMLERMLRAGVRFARLDAVVCDYFPSRG